MRSKTSLLQEAEIIRVARRQALKKANAAFVRKAAKKYKCSERRVYRVLNDEILINK